MPSGFFVSVRACLIVPKQDRDADAAIARIQRIVGVVGGGICHTFNAGKSVAFDATFFDQLPGGFSALRRKRPVVAVFSVGKGHAVGVSPHGHLVGHGAQ